MVQPLAAGSGANSAEVAALSKIADDAAESLEGVGDGAIVAVGGWGGIGIPTELVTALADRGVNDLCLVSNNCGSGVPGDVGVLFEKGRVSRVIATYPTNPKATAFVDRVEKGELTVEITPQGTLAERLRAAGSGIGGFFTRSAAGTLLAEGKEERSIDGLDHVLELPLRCDFALIKAERSDELGNLRFRYAARGLNPVMAMSARVTIVQADHVVPAGSISPDDVHLPGVYVDRIVRTEASV